MLVLMAIIAIVTLAFGKPSYEISSSYANTAYSLY